MFAAPSSTTTFIKPSLLLNKTTPKNSSSKRKHLFRTKIMAKGSSSYLAPDTYHSMSPSDEELIFLHCMLRSSNLDKTMSFFQALGLKETRRKDSEKGKFTLVFMATSPGAPKLKSRTIGATRRKFLVRAFFPLLVFTLIDIFATKQRRRRGRWGISPLRRRTFIRCARNCKRKALRFYDRREMDEWHS